MRYDAEDEEKWEQYQKRLEYQREYRRKRSENLTEEEKEELKKQRRKYYEKHKQKKSENNEYARKYYALFHNKKIKSNNPMKLNQYQIYLLRIHSGLIPEESIAKMIGTPVHVVQYRINRMYLDRYSYKKQKTMERKNISSNLKYQICICDFEGYTEEAISNLWNISFNQIKQLLEAMKLTGEYDSYILKFAACNEAFYRHALRMRREIENNPKNRGAK